MGRTVDLCSTSFGAGASAVMTRLVAGGHVESRCSLIWLSRVLMGLVATRVKTECIAFCSLSADVNIGDDYVRLHFGMLCTLCSRVSISVPNRVL
jgi:hypothetical protein